MIFVFGSNLAGRHGKGAALTALRHHGAIYGQGIGRAGNSYAIPTKSSSLNRLMLDEVNFHVEHFIYYANLNPSLKFKVTRIGCGLAGFSEEDIRPMFKDAPENCLLPTGWW